jgi:hypothetical protein
MTFDRPHSPEDLAAALQYALDHGRLLTLDPDTRLTIDRTLDFTLRGGHYFENGLQAHGAHFTWKSDGNYGTPMFRFQTDGEENKNFVFRGVSAYGDGYAAPPANFLEVRGSSGAAVRNFLIADNTFEHVQTGIYLEGEVFEGFIVRPKGSYCRDNGIWVRQGYEIPGIMSNIFIENPSLRTGPANLGEARGIFCDACASVLVRGGNFIALDGPAILAPIGVKLVSDCSYENVGNTGHAAIVVSDNYFYTTITNIDASNTGGQMTYVLDYGGREDNLNLANINLYNCEVMKPQDAR